MRINFGNLEIHNFKSFLDQSFDFSSMNGMTLVCGKNLDIPGQANSAGKSSIFDALLYALFGQLQTNVKNRNLRNRYSDDPSMSVSICFNIDKKKSYKIERGLNKYSQTFLRAYVLENGETKDISKSSIQETDAFIANEILRCDVSIFLRTILLSSDQNYNFFLLPPAMKKDFIEKLFNIKVFGEMYSLIHKDILAQEKEFAKKQSALLLISKSKEDFSERLKKFDEQSEDKKKEISIKLSNLREKIDELKKKDTSVNEVEISKYENAINLLSEKKIEIEAKLKRNMLEEKKLASKKSKLETLKLSNENTISSHKELLSKLCEHCKPIISEYYSLNEAKNQIKNIEKELEDIRDKDSSISNDTAKFNEKLVKIDSKQKELALKIHSATDESNKTKIEIGSIEKEISLNEKHLKTLDEEKNPYIELFEEASKKLEEENKAISSLNKQYEYLKFAENIVSQDNLKKFIIKDLVGLLNSKIKFYLMKLGAKYTCVFDENMKFTFITPDNGGETEYATFSAGERMRLLIAASFAFRDFMSTRNSFTSNVLILDEFIDSAIDTLAVNNVLQILQEFSRLNNQHVLIISHRKEIDNSIFDNIVMVQKEQNISTISLLPPEK